MFSLLTTSLLVLVWLRGTQFVCGKNLNHIQNNWGEGVQSAFADFNFWELPLYLSNTNQILQSKRHTADENTDWLYLIRDCRLLFHKNDYNDEFIDTNYYKQNKQNDDFELYVTKDRFYKAYGTLPTKTPTDFDKYVTAA